MVGITYVYIDTVFGFYGYFLLTHLDCLVGHVMLFWVSYMNVFCILYLHLFSAVEHVSH